MRSMYIIQHVFGPCPSVYVCVRNSCVCRCVLFCVRMIVRPRMLARMHVRVRGRVHVD